MMNFVLRSLLRRHHLGYQDGVNAACNAAVRWPSDSVLGLGSTAFELVPQPKEPVYASEEPTTAS